MSFRRILVALDASAHSLAALQAASEMAAWMESELVGLFLEDINLVRLAGLPFAREVGFPSAISRELDVVAMERALKLVAVQAKQAIAATAERAHVPWSFSRCARLRCCGAALCGTGRRSGSTWQSEPPSRHVTASGLHGAKRNGKGAPRCVCAGPRGLA